MFSVSVHENEIRSKYPTHIIFDFGVALPGGNMRFAVVFLF